MPVPTPEDFEAAGLYDPDDTSVVGRLELLEWLWTQSFSIEDMQHAHATNALGAMVGDRFLVPGELFGRAVALERSGLTGDSFDLAARALGFEPLQGSPSGEVGYTDDEVELLEVLDALSTVFTPDEATALLRVVGASISRMAEAAVSLFLADVESPSLRERRSELELAQSVAGAVQLVDGMAARLDPLLRRHMLQAIERTRATTIDELERFQYRYGVGFVDLVGFTSLSRNLSASELSAFIGRFEASAHEVVAAAGARVVKLIGDEVMFVATDPSAVCGAGQALIDAFDDASGVLPRGGMAYGNVVLRGGDYYGTVVNLASRLADAAVPGELLVSDVLAASTEEFEFEPAGRRMVKGFDEPVPVYSVLR